MHVVLLGASRGVGYHTLLNLLQDSTNKCTVLLRDPSKLESDPKIPAGSVEIVKGDATVVDDLRKLFTTKVDLVVSSIGGVPTFGLSGIKLVGQQDLCTAAARALVRVLSELEAEDVPRVVAVSSMGIGENHKVMPFLMRQLYYWTLESAHADKEGMEYVLLRASRTQSPPADVSAPLPRLISPDALKETKEGFLDELIIVRPAALVGDAAARDESVVKVGEELATYTVRRSEVGRFIARECVPGKNEWVGKLPIVGT
ncbi:hypothetical protein P7C73_g4764, partial [Tremellales sp. Uapishka_1]